MKKGKKKEIFKKKKVKPNEENSKGQKDKLERNEEQNIVENFTTPLSKKVLNKHP